ncbi:MAG: hypothetical protein V3W41_04995 [Planctomycetota bacterium]
MTRKKPETWDQKEVHTAKCCPHCEGKFKACRTAEDKPSYRERFIEDIVLERPETVLNEIRQYCGGGRKRVESAVTDAMPGDHIGLKVVNLTAVQHYLHGITVSRIVELLLKQQHGFAITGGALVKSWQRLAGLFQSEYDDIHNVCRRSGFDALLRRNQLENYGANALALLLLH